VNHLYATLDTATHQARPELAAGTNQPGLLEHARHGISKLTIRTPQRCDMLDFATLFCPFFDALIMKKLEKTLEGIIFWSRWMQAPLYLGLIAALGVYVVQFFSELFHLITITGVQSENDIMLIVLGLIDVVMIANLLIMVIIGGYETFVSRLNLDDHPDQPEWLSHVNAGVLKIKLSTAIISISSIHLLKTFINPVGHIWQAQVAIHITFIVSAIAMAYTDKLMYQSAQMSKVPH
jgi:uncharacterized protein (TIGR00645 family)